MKKFYPLPELYRTNYHFLNDIKTDDINYSYFKKGNYENYEDTKNKLDILKFKINKSYAIIQGKNNIIQEYRDILEVSKNKIQNIIKKREQIFHENKLLKNKLSEKEQEIINLKEKIEELKKQKKDKSHSKTNTSKEPLNVGNKLRYHRKLSIYTECEANKYKQKSFKNKFNIDPLDYSFLLLDNLINNMSHIKK